MYSYAEHNLLDNFNFGGEETIWGNKGKATIPAGSDLLC